MVVITAVSPIVYTWPREGVQSGVELCAESFSLTSSVSGLVRCHGMGGVYPNFDGDVPFCWQHTGGC